MATIIITRSSEYTNRLRRIEVLVDGISRCRIANGERVTLEVSAGTHRIDTRIDWTGSTPYTVTLSENEERQLYLSGFKGSKYLQMLSLVLLVIVLIPGRFIGFDKFWLEMAIAVPALCYLIYVLSFGRQKYLRLEPVDSAVN